MVAEVWTGTVFLEIPQGGGVRHRFGGVDGTVTVEPFPRKEVVPALRFVGYGCIPGTRNPADGDCADVYLLGAENHAAGTLVSARAVGIRLRLNGDHKALTVPLTGPFAGVERVGEVPASALALLGRWDEPAERPGETWGDAEEATAWIRASQTPTAR